MKIDHYDGLSRTPALDLALKGWMELRERNFVDPGAIMVMWDHKALVASDVNGDLIGVITYAHLEWQKEFYINIGYVLPNQRRRGVYRELWNELVKTAQEKGVVNITGTTDVKNTEMRVTAEHLGRAARGVYYGFLVPPKTP